MSNGLPKLYTKAEVAEALRIHINTLDQWIVRGAIKPRYIGRRVLFTAKEVERFIGRDHAAAGPQMLGRASQAS